MFNKFKKFFKLNNWKRWTFLICTFLLGSFFIGLSFGLKSKDTILSNKYQSGINLSIKPQNIDSSANINNVAFDLKERVKNNYPYSSVNVEVENNNIINLTVSNIVSNQEKDQFLVFLTNKEKIVLTNLVGSVLTSDSFFKGANNINLNEKKFDLSIDPISSLNLYNNLVASNTKNVLIWKESMFNKLKQIVNNPSSSSLNGNFNGNYFDYLYVNNYSPAQASLNNSNNSLKPILKEKIYEVDQNGNVINTYNSNDFLLSWNTVDDFKPSQDSTSGISTISSKFNWDNNIDNQKMLNIYYEAKFGLSPYNLNTYIISKNIPFNNNNSSLILMICAIIILSFVAIMLIANYGYLGLIGIFILGIIIFLSLLFINIFRGDYDPFSIMALVISLTISLELIISLAQKIKNLVSNGNSISKSAKLTFKDLEVSFYFKNICLFLLLISIYLLTSFLANSFSTINLIILIFSPFVSILLFKILIYLCVGIKQIENNYRFVGFWTKNSVNCNVNLYVNEELNNEDLSDNINNELSEISNENINKDKKSKKKTIFNNLFNTINKHSKAICISLITFIVLGGLLTFLIAYFMSPNQFGFNLTNGSLNRYVLTVANVNINDPMVVKLLENANISNYSYFDNFTNLTKTLKIYFNQSVLQTTIDSISQKFNQLGYQSLIYQLNSGITFSMLLYTFYGLILGIGLISIFILFWMNWTSAITFLSMILLGSILFVSLAMFTFVTISLETIIIISFAYVLMIINFLNTLINIKIELKTTRIFNLTYKNITNVFANTLRSNFKSSALFNFSIIIIFLLMLCFYTTINFNYLIFMIAFTLIIFLLSNLLMPKIIASFETIRIKRINKKIKIHYWETEKVKEQIFSGINNIK